MGLSMDIKIKTDNTEQAKKELLEKLPVALEAVGLQAEAYAKKLCPTKTSRLKNSISHGVIESENTAFIGSNVEYASYVELGTSKMKARPYLKPAVQNHTEEYKKIFETYIKN